jgi:hypothetical protein
MSGCQFVRIFEPCMLLVEPKVWAHWTEVCFKPGLCQLQCLGMKNTHITFRGWKDIRELQGMPGKCSSNPSLRTGPAFMYRFFADPEDSMPQLKYQPLPHQETRSDHHPVRLWYPRRLTISCCAWYKSICICTIPEHHGVFFRNPIYKTVSSSVKQNDPITMPDHSRSHFDTSDSLAGLPGTPEVNNRRR